MKKNNDICGKSGDSHTTQEKSKVVCKHLRMGDQFNFSHVGQQDYLGSWNQSKKSIVAGRNGPVCSKEYKYLSSSMMSEYHKIDPNKYPIKFGCHIIYQTNV